MTNDDPLDAALAFVEILDRLNLPYALVGSMASSLHGEPRTTRDADFVARIPPAQADRLISALATEFYVPEDRLREAVRTGGSFNVVHLPTMFKIDVFANPSDDLGRAQVDRRLFLAVRHEPERSIAVASPEDTLVQKLRWYRLSEERSDHQWSDSLGIARTVGDALDRAYTRRAAAPLGLTDLLDRLFAEADRTR